ncbi:MAG: amidohydrolase [Deltaproteobacteria bacterium]|jgi:predicted TIM-barrel fold metal-dependent hydrolase|nr:amidohydrolase [Deltaproteobacteria bacterium]
MDRHIVVSSDCHAGLPPEQYRSYVDPQYRDAFDHALPIQIEMTKTMERSFLIADINAEWREGHEKALTGAWDHAERMKVMDGDGIAVEVIFPDGITEQNAPPFGAGFAMPTAGVVPELQWAGCRAHNRWVTELVDMAPERRLGLACIPMLWDVEEAVREIRLSHEAGLRGIIIPPIWGDRPAYHHDRYDPVWEICQDLDMPIHVHIGPSPIEQYFGPLSALQSGEASAPTGAMGAYLSEVVWWSSRTATFLIWGGVFERYPKLKFSIVEGAIDWVPDFLRLIDVRYKVTPQAQKLGDYISHLSMKPSDYFRRNIRLGAACMSPSDGKLSEVIGGDCIMWGSDYPHPEGSWPHTKDQMLEALAGLSEEEAAAQLGGNAIEFYALDPEELAPIAARIGPEKASFR